MKTKVLISTLCVLSSIIVKAEIIPSHEKTELRLGFGVDPVTENVYKNCINYQGNQLVPEDQFAKYSKPADVPARALDMEVELVTSYNQVDKYTNTSISADVRYAAYSGSISYNEESRYSLESDRAMVGIQATADYGRWYLPKVTLKPEFKKLYNEDPESFYEVCGREYVSGFVAGQGMRILLATEKLSIYSYRKIQMSMKAAANTGALKASVGASFMSVAEELSKMGSLSVNLFTFGGPQFKEMSEFIKSDSDITKLRNNVAKLASQMTVNQAVRTAWITQPYPGLEKEENKMLDEQKRRTLHNLYQTFRHIASARDRLVVAISDGLGAHLRPFCKNGFEGDCEKYIESVNERLTALEDAIDLIHDRYNLCWRTKDISECRMPPVGVINVDRLTQIKWPARYKYELYQQYLNEIEND